MSEMKSLADQLRSTMKEPVAVGNKTRKNNSANAKEVNPKSNAPPEIPAILEEIRAYDNSDHKSMVHARFDENTIRFMNQFKLATGVDVTKLVAFSVRQLVKQHPELKTIIKQFFQKLDE